VAERVMPIKGTADSKEFLRIWETSNAQGKRDLCNLVGVSYSRAKHVVANYRNEEKAGEIYEHIGQQMTDDVPWVEQIKIFQGMDRLVGLHIQVPSEVVIEIETISPIGIVYSADWQLGQPGVDYESFQRDMEIIRDEKGLFCEIGGDGYQNLIQPSKIGSSHNQMPIASQRGLFVLTLKELKEKIKVLRTGNHNYWSTLAVGEDWELELSRRLKLLYMKHYGKVHWKVGDIFYTEVAMHKGRFNSVFNETHSNKQHQRLNFPDARIIVVEDKHIADVEQYRYNDMECAAIRTGTYAIYDDYAQQNGFFGAHVSNPMVVLYPDRDHLVVFKDMWDGIEFLRAVRKRDVNRSVG
jgi:hypothetical protein